jgi:hypothetical protein
MRRFIAITLLAIGLVGCHKQEIAKVPQINLDNLPDQRVEAPLALMITDARPEWERRYFEGAITLVPLEQLTPSPMDRLEWEIQCQARELPEPPCRVFLELQSFRVANCTQESLPTLEGVVLGFPQKPLFESCGSGYGAIFFLGLYVTVVGVVDIAILGYDAAIAAKRYVHHANDRPRELVTDYATGVNCDIRVAARLEWPDGRRQAMEIRGLVNRSDLPAEKVTSGDHGEDIRLVVHAACVAVGKEFAERVLHPDAAARLGPKTPAPAFTAFSGN